MCKTPGDFNDGYEAFTKYLHFDDRDNRDGIDTYIDTCTGGRNTGRSHIHDFGNGFRSENDKDRLDRP